MNQNNVLKTILGPLAFERGRGRSHSKGRGLGGFSLSLSGRHEVCPHQRRAQKRHMSKLLKDENFKKGLIFF